MKECPFRLAKLIFLRIICRQCQQFTSVVIQKIKKVVRLEKLSNFSCL